MKKKSLFILSTIALLAVGCSKQSTITDVEFSLNDFEDSIEIHNSDILNHFVTNIEATIADVNCNYVDAYAQRLYKGEDITINNPINLTWTAKPVGGSISSYTILVGEKQDLSDAYTVTSSTESYNFYNAKVDTTYYWAVKVGDFVSDTHSFSTNKTIIRSCSVEGVNNVRDIGGYGTIKQGLLYRGEPFEKYNKNTKEVEPKITSSGVETLTKQLGIKTEVDLRRNDDENENCGLTKSTVDGVNYVALPMQYHNQNILTYNNGAYGNYNNPARIKDFFELLADRNNYPVYFHCSQGKDRTGCLAYLVEALMGTSDTYMMTDYLLSSLALYNAKMTSGGINTQYGKTLRDYQQEGWTYSETVYNYLKDVVGISSATLDSVKNILSVK